MKCIYYGKGLCNVRQGKVLTEEEVKHPDIVPDRDFCIHKNGKDCACATDK